MNRKMTAWKKSRKLGDVMGGRRWPKIENHVLRREHSLTPPASGQCVPILIEENPSRDYYFPVTGEQARTHLLTFPEEDIEGLTHLWFRRLKTRECVDGARPLAEYVHGSKVHAIILYPWRRDNLLPFGERRPSSRALRQYSRWTADLVNRRKKWYLRWTEETLRDFYFTALLGHEVGHHRDRKRSSRANVKQREEAAEQYALQWMPEGERLHSIRSEV